MVRTSMPYLVYGDQRWSLEMCSGMERFISGLAIELPQSMYVIYHDLISL